MPFKDGNAFCSSVYPTSESSVPPLYLENGGCNSLFSIGLDVIVVERIVIFVETGGAERAGNFWGYSRGRSYDNTSFEVSKYSFEIRSNFLAIGKAPPYLASWLLFFGLIGVPFSV